MERVAQCVLKAVDPTEWHLIKTALQYAINGKWSPELIKRYPLEEGNGYLDFRVIPDPQDIDSLAEQIAKIDGVSIITHNDSDGVRIKVSRNRNLNSIFDNPYGGTQYERATYRIRSYLRQEGKNAPGLSGLVRHRFGAVCPADWTNLIMRMIDILDLWEYTEMIGPYGYNVQITGNTLNFLAMNDENTEQVVAKIGRIDGIALVSNIGFSQIITVNVSRNGQFHVIFEDNIADYELKPMAKF